MFWNSLFENWILKLSNICSVIGEITKASRRSSERVTLYCRFQRNTTIKWGCAVVPVGGQEHTLSLRAFSLRLWIGLHRTCSRTDPYLKSADGADSQKELGGVSHLCCQLLSFVLLPPASCNCSCLPVAMSMHFSKIELRCRLPPQLPVSTHGVVFMLISYSFSPLNIPPPWQCRYLDWIQALVYLLCELGQVSWSFLSPSFPIFKWGW